MRKLLVILLLVLLVGCGKEPSEDCVRANRATVVVEGTVEVHAMCLEYENP